MHLIKSLFIKFLCLPLAVALSLELGLDLGLALAIVPLTAAATQADKQSNPPPPLTNPGSSAAGGRRDSLACPQDAGAETATPLTALAPTATPGLALAAHPTFLVHVPRTRAENAEFSLRDRTGRGVYRTTIALLNTPGIVSITLPDGAAPLQVGTPYTWSFAVICNPNDRLADQFVTGTVQRIELAARLAQIEQAPLSQRLALYRENNIWYDALALLFESRRSQPNDPDIRTIWREFLQSGGIDPIIDSSSDR